MITEMKLVIFYFYVKGIKKLKNLWENKLCKEKILYNYQILCNIKNNVINKNLFKLKENIHLKFIME